MEETQRLLERGFFLFVPVFFRWKKQKVISVRLVLSNVKAKSEKKGSS